MFLIYIFFQSNFNFKSWIYTKSIYIFHIKIYLCNLNVHQKWDYTFLCKFLFSFWFVLDRKFLYIASSFILMRTFLVFCSQFCILICEKLFIILTDLSLNCKKKNVYKNELGDLKSFINFNVYERDFIFLWEKLQ